MELYKIDLVNERCWKLNEVTQKIYRQVGLLGSIAHLLEELSQSKDMDFDKVQTCRHLLQQEASVLEKLAHELDETESFSRRDYQNGRPTYQWKD